MQTVFQISQEDIDKINADDTITAFMNENPNIQDNEIDQEILPILKARIAGILNFTLKASQIGTIKFGSNDQNKIKEVQYRKIET